MNEIMSGEATPVQMSAYLTALSLKGETIEIEPEEAENSKGWQLLCVSGYPLGWGKLVNGLLKNKFLASWRLS